MKPFVFLIAYLLLVPNINGQVAEDSELYKQLKSVDSLLFEEGFNHCNLEILKSMMHPDLQFLHDQNGMQDLDAFFQGFEESICSNPDFKPIRKLVKGSLQVYPLKKASCMAPSRRVFMSFLLLSLGRSYGSPSMENLRMSGSWIRINGVCFVRSAMIINSLNDIPTHLRTIIHFLYSRMTLILNR